MGSSRDDLRKYVGGRDGIFTVRGSKLHRTWNNIQYKTGLSAKKTLVQRSSR